MLLTEFFSRHGKLSKEEFLEAFAGAFLLGRREKAAPYLLHITRNTELKVVIGNDEDVEFDIDDPTLDARHAVVVFHEGFKGWTLEDKATSFGTHVDGDRVQPNQPVLLRDRSTIKAGGMTQLQFYLSETLYGRMAKAGITRSMRTKQSKDKHRAELIDAEEAKAQAEATATAEAEGEAEPKVEVDSEPKVDSKPKVYTSAKRSENEDAALAAELDALGDEKPTEKVDPGVIEALKAQQSADAAADADSGSGSGKSDGN